MILKNSEIIKMGYVIQEFIENRKALIQKKLINNIYQKSLKK
jgi:hypothetical protein